MHMIITISPTKRALLISFALCAIVSCKNPSKPIETRVEPEPSAPSIPWVRRDPANKSVIVFVHGVLGNALTTWSDGKQYWPSMLTKDPTFDGQNIYVYSYPTRTLGGSLSVDQLSDNMRLVLSTDGVFTHSSIIFVSHSMGGLVTRAFILKYRTAIASKIRFLYFYATPTTGSPYATLAGIMSRNPQFGDLYPMDVDSYLGSLQSDWLAADLQLKSYCAYETQPLYGQFLIVDRSSATNLCTERLDPIDETHITIVKPSGAGSDSYRALKGAMLETKELRPDHEDTAATPPNRDHTSTVDPMIIASYISWIASQSDPGARASMIDGLDIAVPPAQAVRTAMQYAVPKNWLVDPSEKPVFDAAIRVLKRMKEPGREALMEIRQGTAMPAADIAGAILGDSARVWVRISLVDDFADLSVNGIPIGRRLTFGQDSGWLDVTGNFMPDKINNLKLLITNGPAGGSGGKLQISAGTEQYDSGLIYLDRCPCDAPAFDIESKISPSKSGTVRIFDAKINYF